MAARVSWRAEEVVLALELYLMNPPRPNRRARSPLVALLRESLPLLHPGREVGSEVRDDASVRRKIENLEHLHTGARPGAEKGGTVTEAVFGEYGTSLGRVRVAADAVRFDLEQGREPVTAGSEREGSAIEGDVRWKSHRYRERSIRDAKLREVTKGGGQLRCEGCGFLGSERYGGQGEGLIEVHHKVPLGELEGEVETTTRDLALVCPSCHRLIHRKVPGLRWQSFLRLTERLREGRDGM